MCFHITVLVAGEIKLICLVCPISLGCTALSLAKLHANLRVGSGEIMTCEAGLPEFDALLAVLSIMAPGRRMVFYLAVGGRPSCRSYVVTVSDVFACVSQRKGGQGLLDGGGGDGTAAGLRGAQGRRARPR